MSNSLFSIEPYSTPYYEVLWLHGVLYSVIAINIRLQFFHLTNRIHQFIVFFSLCLVRNHHQRKHLFGIDIKLSLYLTTGWNGLPPIALFSTIYYELIDILWTTKIHLKATDRISHITNVERNAQMNESAKRRPNNSTDKSATKFDYAQNSEKVYSKRLTVVAVSVCAPLLCARLRCDEYLNATIESNNSAIIVTFHQRFFFT